ncbi:hypothetical protein CCAX7_25170 [Capsulimonas corticalis]|uniref:Uncharacterized protein n=1 Tax=Capsulimonas corticalis TaxID=2219043 RepID=A0A402CVP6_9BACT|nr:hypothetical protein CCAX7_25170 [Capsulimonas corticalis]
MDRPFNLWDYGQRRSDIHPQLLSRGKVHGKGRKHVVETRQTCPRHPRMRWLQIGARYLPSWRKRKQCVKRPTPLRDGFSAGERDGTADRRPAIRGPRNGGVFPFNAGPLPPGAPQDENPRGRFHQHRSVHRARGGRKGAGHVADAKGRQHMPIVQRQGRFGQTKRRQWEDR